MKKIISLILVLAMVLGMGATLAFADDEPKYGAYFAFGDSMTRGVGTEDWISPSSLSKSYDYSVRNVYGATGTNLNEAYPYIVSKALDCTSNDSFIDIGLHETVKYYPVAAAGLSLSAVMDLFGINPAEPDMLYDHNTDMLHAYYRDLVPMFGIKNKTKVTLEDSVYFALAKEEWCSKFPDLQLDTEIENKTALVGDIESLIIGAKNPVVTLNLGLTDVILKPMQTMQMPSTGVNPSDVNMLAGVVDGYNYWRVCYPLLVNKLHELNPNVTVVLVGFFNPYAEVTLTDHTTLPIGDILNPIIAAMNLQCQTIADTFSFVEYADIYNAETPNKAFDKSMSGDLTIRQLIESIAQGQDGFNTEDSNKEIAVQLAEAMMYMDPALMGGEPAFKAMLLETLGSDFSGRIDAIYTAYVDYIKGEGAQAAAEAQAQSTAYEYYGHLTADGNKYIARQILKALYEKELSAEDKAGKYSGKIRVDVGREEFTIKENITSITFAGDPQNYTLDALEAYFDGYELVIPFTKAYATTMRITYLVGSTVKQVDYLIVEQDGQYVAVRVHGTDDALEEAEKVQAEKEEIADIAKEVAVKAAVAAAVTTVKVVNEVAPTLLEVPGDLANVGAAIYFGSKSVAEVAANGASEVRADLENGNFVKASFDAVDNTLDFLAEVHDAGKARRSAVGELAKDVAQGIGEFIDKLPKPEPARLFTR